MPKPREKLIAYLCSLFSLLINQRFFLPNFNFITKAVFYNA